ncbi:formate dehydrogenase accessory sulfurtransferase FdhD [Flavitalea flava]
MPDSIKDQLPGIARLPVFKYHAAALTEHAVGQQENASGLSETEDLVAVEEPLEIRLIYGPGHQRKEQSVSVTMRTPGNDAELATGFLFTEGIIGSSPGDIIAIHQTGGIPDNIVRMEMKDNLNLDLGKLQRNFYTSSSCGVCGKSSIDAIKTLLPPGTGASSLSNNHSGKKNAEERISSLVIRSLPQQLRRQQALFDSTGGLHASALFDYTGNFLVIREDIGRHNALDKVVGHALNNNWLPLEEVILLLSGRACFELIQKAAMAGIKIIAAIGPPSSLAVQLATEYDITLIGFLREDRFNIYVGGKRISIK